MTADVFIVSIQACLTLPAVFKNRLVGLAQRLDATVRGQIVAELEECERREQKIMERGGRNIAAMEKKLAIRSRTSKEAADRSAEALPDFDS